MESLSRIKQAILGAYLVYLAKNNQEPHSAVFDVNWRNYPEEISFDETRVYIGTDAIDYNINDTDYSFFVDGLTELVELVENNNTNKDTDCEFLYFKYFE